MCCSYAFRCHEEIMIISCYSCLIYSSDTWKLFCKIITSLVPNWNAHSVSTFGRKYLLCTPVTTPQFTFSTAFYTKHFPCSLSPPTVLISFRPPPLSCHSLLYVLTRFYHWVIGRSGVWIPQPAWVREGFLSREEISMVFPSQKCFMFILHPTRSPHGQIVATCYGCKINKV